MRFEDMGIAWLPVEELVPYDNNAKRHMSVASESVRTRFERSLTAVGIS